MSPDEQKRAAGGAAAELVQSGMRVGLGTGSTAAWFVKALAARAVDIRCVSTSLATEALAVSLGLRTISLDEAGCLDLTVDGADEIGPGLALIKGGGAALLREKLVWEASERCVVIADAAKHVQCLGAFPLPIEVWRLAMRPRRLESRLSYGAMASPPRQYCVEMAAMWCRPTVRISFSTSPAAKFWTRLLWHLT